MPPRRDPGRSQAHKRQPAGEAVHLPVLPLAPTSGIEAVERVGPGRPAGARNKINELVAKIIAARGYRQPWEMLVEAYSRPVEQLARELGCKKSEAFELQRRCATDLLPYTLRKMPVAVEVSSDTPQVADERAAVGAMLMDAIKSGLIDPRALFGKTIENQPVSEALPVDPNNPPSNKEG